DLAKEIEHFFSVYTELEGKQWHIDGWGSHAEAVEEIERCRERFDQQGS
ncbi:MAG: inorganic diphosphatase, partial [Thermoleophilaceae bacterium]|nr:inorganic diphosphatase [Thermoleophilaceae bacterium]